MPGGTPTTCRQPTRPPWRLTMEAVAKHSSHSGLKSLLTRTWEIRRWHAVLIFDRIPRGARWDTFKLGTHAPKPLLLLVHAMLDAFERLRVLMLGAEGAGNA